MFGASNRKELIQKEKKTLFAKDIVTKNPIFTLEHIEEFYSLFNLYADNTRKVDVKDMLNTARTLGFDRKYKLIYEGLIKVSE